MTNQDESEYDEYRADAQRSMRLHKVSLSDAKDRDLDLEFQGYLLDKDRTEKELVDWIKLIMVEIQKRNPKTPYEFRVYAI